MEKIINKTDFSGGTARRYKTLLADPPWDINQSGNYGASNHYDLMTLDQIKAMPIQDLAEENSHCWLWVTNGTLRYGYDVLEAWGFTPRSVFTWIKLRMGLGVYLRAHPLWNSWKSPCAMQEPDKLWHFPQSRSFT